MQEQNPIVLMNFSGIYREEEFWKNRQVSWIELQDVCGTNCYCDEEAIAEINKRTENYPTAGIHFIDSGNYHYMTRLWLTRMDQPFCLLVYDIIQICSLRLLVGFCRVEDGLRQRWRNWRI